MFMKTTNFEDSIIKYLFVTVIVVCSFSTSKSQDTNQTRFGLFGHYLLSIHSADFTKLPGIPNCCPRFESGSGSGYTFGALFEYPVSKSFLLGARFGLQSIGATLTADENTTIIVDGVARRGTFTHTVAATLQNVGVDGLLIWNPVKKLFISTGLRVGMVNTSTFTQEERITSPANGATFLDSNGNDSRTRVRNEFSGDIPQATSSYLGLLLGLGYEFPLNKSKTMLIAPELFYQLGISSVAESMNWNANGLRVGLALKYSLPQTKPTISNTIVLRDTIEVQSENEVGSIVLKSKNSATTTKETPSNYELTETIIEVYENLLPKKGTKSTADGKSDFATSLTVVGLTENGEEYPINSIDIEEYESTVFHPLLPNIFFSEGSAELQSKYKNIDPSKTSAYSINTKELSTIDVYYDILNIIGYRLKQQPKTTITLIGCNSNVGSEEGNTSLSSNRANTVKEYLVSKWGINPKQILVESKNLPIKPSNVSIQDGIEENRRVEITSSNPEILAVVISKDAYKKITPEVVRIKPSVQTNEDIKDAQITNNNVILQKSNSVKPFDVQIARLTNNFNTNDLKLKFIFEASTVSNKTSSANSSVNVTFKSLVKKKEDNSNDKQIDFYKLLLFDFNSSSFGDYNNSIAKIIKVNIKPTSTITITGYTDRIGDETINKKLSLDRATEAKKVLNVPKAITTGLGEETLLFDNNTPEGRMYSRTVEIIVETPLN